MAADVFVVPTVTFRLLFVLVVLAHDRRRIVHVAVTDHPTAVWIAQQLRNAFPDDRAPRYLVHDRDGAFAAAVRRSMSGNSRRWRCPLPRATGSGNDQTKQHFTPLVYVPFRQQPTMRAVSNVAQSFPGANVLVRIGAPFGNVGEAIHVMVRKTHSDASLGSLMTLRANVAFDRDRMDGAHGELANHSMAGQVWL